MPTGCCKALIRYSLCCLSMFNSIKAAGRRPTADKNGGVRQKQTIAIAKITQENIFFLQVIIKPV